MRVNSQVEVHFLCYGLYLVKAVTEIMSIAATSSCGEFVLLRYCITLH